MPIWAWLIIAAVAIAIVVGVIAAYLASQRQTEG
jgi:hypothetical protein